MYTQFFGFTKRPFVLSPDPEFIYFSKGHDLAFTHLEYGLAHNLGFIALTGDVGAGKTTLLKYLLEKVNPSLNLAMIFNTQVAPHSLLEMLVKEFELTPSSVRKSDLFDALYQKFIAEYSKGNRCIVVVDEAQNLSLQSFEELRMLSNLDAGSDLLVQIILVGQPQLRKRLAHPSLSQLTQRISVHYHLMPMKSDEIGQYIKHRLKVAGCENPNNLFDEDAIEHIANGSGGIPRIINSICDTSLTYAFADRAEKVSREIVEKVIEDNELLLSGLGCSETFSAEGSEPEAGPLPHPLLDPENSDAAQGIGPDLRMMLSDVLRRLVTVEARLEEMNGSERDKTIEVLHSMLEKERERTTQQSLKITEVTRKYKLALRELHKIRDAQDIPEYKTDDNEKNGKIWRIFSREKK